MGSARESTPEDGPRRQALDRLVEEHGARLYSLGVHFCGDPEQARDLVQETFLQAFRHWDSFEGRSKVSTWLYTIASRVCQRFQRRKSGEPERIASLEELVPFGEGEMGVVPRQSAEPLDEELRREAQRSLEAAICELPVTFRMPLVLKEVVGFSVAEVAEILGLKEATVKTRLHRARMRLRGALESALPRREVPPPAYSKRVCLDLLAAKQEALDRGVDFEFPPGVVCERCAELFATLDLTQDLCADVARGPLPEELRQALERLTEAEAGGGGVAS